MFFGSLIGGSCINSNYSRDCKNSFVVGFFRSDGGEFKLVLGGWLGKAVILVEWVEVG